MGETCRVSGWTEQSKMISAPRSRVCGQLVVADVTTASADGSLAQGEEGAGEQGAQCLGLPRIPSVEPQERGKNLLLHHSPPFP